ncbi:MAG: head GIN domain-containing protein [Rubrivivax sp.]
MLASATSSCRRLLLGALVLLPVSAAVRAATTGSGRAGTESRSVSGFQAIAVSDAIELAVRQGSQEALTLSADDNLLPLIETAVEDGRHGRTLMIRLRRGESVHPRTPIKAVVDVLRLQALAVAGSGDVSVGALQTPALDLGLAGSADVRLQRLETERLAIRIAGSGDVQAAGSAAHLTLRIAGSGDAELAALVVDEASVSISGSGDAELTAQKSLAVTIAGSGDVTYGGAVTAVRSSVAGSGRVRRRAG